MKRPVNGRIRRATESDAADVLRCLAAAFEPYSVSYTPGGYEDTVPAPEALLRRLRLMTVLVAEDESGAIVGTIAHHVGPSGDGHLRGMAVVPQWHGLGTAALLLRSAEDELTRLGCSRVTLDTTQPLQRATRFYERQGYQPTGRVTDFHGMPLFEYAKPLSPASSSAR